MRPKTESERRNEAAQAELAAAERAARDAEKRMTSASSKLLTKRRSLDNLDHTISHADADQNEKANRYGKRGNLTADISGLEGEFSSAEADLSAARERVRAASIEANNSAASYSIETDQERLAYEKERRDLAVRSQELSERKFEQAERTAKEAAQAKLQEARISAQNADRMARDDREFKAASQRFDWEQRIAERERDIEARLTEIDRASVGQIELAQIQGQIAEESAKLHHLQNLETIEANTLADVTRIRTTAEEHRKNVTHEVNEDVRKAFEMLGIREEQARFETMNAIKLMVLKHQLDKNFETHKTKLAREGRGDDLAELAADYQRASNWIAQQEQPD